MTLSRTKVNKCVFVCYCSLINGVQLPNNCHYFYITWLSSFKLLFIAVPNKSISRLEMGDYRT